MYMAYAPRGEPGNGRKTVIAEEIEAITKERMGEADEPPSGMIAKHHKVYKLYQFGCMFSN